MSETEPTREQLSEALEGCLSGNDAWGHAVLTLALEAIDRRAELATLTARVAEQAQEIADVKAELNSVCGDWNAIVAAIGSPTHGGAVGRAKQLQAKLQEQAQEIAHAMKVLAPNVPESGLVDAARQVKQVAITEAENSTLLERKCQEQAQEIERLKARQ